jgi:stress response protein YsnF
MISNKFENYQRDYDGKNVNQLASNSEVLSQETIPLLEERLIVNFTQHKMGEVVVRKVIETHVLNINIPIRHEKLIVEQVAPTYKQLAVVELEGTTFNEKELYEKYPEILKLAVGNADKDNAISKDTSIIQTIVKGEIASLEDAHKFLDSVFIQISNNCEGAKVEVTLRKISSE